MKKEDFIGSAYDTEMLMLIIAALLDKLGGRYTITREDSDKVNGLVLHAERKIFSGDIVLKFIKGN